jgi:thioredoxin-like negative regulator of GroEL
VQELKEIQTIIEENSAVMLYFSASTCSVCHVLKPKLLDAIESNFKNFKVVDIDVSLEQEIAGQYSVFALPTIIIFLDGKEFIRKSRNMSVDEVIREIKRPYEIMMS